MSLARSSVPSSSLLTKSQVSLRTENLSSARAGSGSSGTNCLSLYSRLSPPLSRRGTRRVTPNVAVDTGTLRQGLARRLGMACRAVPQSACYFDVGRPLQARISG